MRKKLRLRISRRKSLALLIISAFIVVIAGEVSYINWEARQNAIDTLNGQLTPFPIDLSNPFKLLLSQGVVFSYDSVDLSQGFNLTSLFPFGINFTDSTFSINFVNGKMFVSAEIRDSNNTLIAKIVNNEWKTVNPDTLLFWDRNYNAYAFEIMGLNNIPTLQVIMVGQNEIQIGGLFFTKTGSIYIAPMKNGEAMMYVNVGNQHLEEKDTIYTIFKYPCLTNSSNLGKMNSSFYPSSDPLLLPTILFIGGIAVSSIASITFAFALESYMFQRRVKQESRRIITTKQHIGQGNPYYRKHRDKKGKK